MENGLLDERLDKYCAYECGMQEAKLSELYARRANKSSFHASCGPLILLFPAFDADSACICKMMK
jgi:hypothetical protein